MWAIWAMRGKRWPDRVCEKPVDCCHQATELARPEAVAKSLGMSDAG
jgi:hypothetical protein